MISDLTRGVYQSRIESRAQTRCEPLAQTKVPNVSALQTGLSGRVKPSKERCAQAHRVEVARIEGVFGRLLLLLPLRQRACFCQYPAIHLADICLNTYLYRI
jgi:hypothetical protein